MECHGIIPSTALNLTRDYKQHKVICSSIEIEQDVMGGEAEIINRRHFSTLIRDRAARFRHS